MTSPFTRLAAYIWRLYATDGVPSSGAHEPKKEEIITWGTEMEALLSDAPSRVGMQYKFSDSTNMSADAGDGYVWFNMASPAPEGVTEIAVSDVDVFGLSFENFWATVDDSTSLANRATIIIRDADADFSAVFRVTGANIDAAGYTRIQVEWVDGSGAFVDEAAVGILVFPTGDQGGTKIAISIFDTGGPVSGEPLWRAPVPEAAVFLAGLTESYGYCVNAPTGSATFSLRRAPKATPNTATQFGTATFSAGQFTATFAAASDTLFAAGDILEIVAPSPADLTLNKPTFTIIGYLST